MHDAPRVASGTNGVLNAPNVLSLSRIAVAPVLIWLLTDPSRDAGAIAAIVFVLACVSDWLDGYLARSRGLSTQLGKFLDPLADKVLVISALIMLAAMPEGPRVPAWIVATIAARELAVTGLRTIALGEGIVVGAESLGKVKMAFEVVALTSLLVRYRYWLLDFFSAGMVFLWIAMLLALWSGVAYHVRLIRVLQERS
ncbi:MAG TPA: CDP-diacylglycerol--glycerol-3-phosphate 3-phosphatidyltransferase [Candidatus Binatia bacterium]|nr:CDP-diacylglycerol--glycerol-3-phosphate 3-phosphatidyltransferase [Candidatus Binatia bacterium]